MPRSRALPGRLRQRVPPTVLVLAVALGLVGCAGGGSGTGSRPKPKSAVEVLADAPSWVTQGCRAHWPDEEERRRVVCGVGSAPPHRNRVRARTTAIARARSEIARSLQVTIEDMVRLAERDGSTGPEEELDTLVHQLSTASLQGCQVESVWRSETGEVHALVSLGVDRVAGTVRSAPAIAPPVRERIAERAEEAFAELDAAFETEADPGDD